METTSFVLGMLSIIVAAFAVVVVWGIVKINKLTVELKTTHKQLNDDFNQIYRRISDVERQTKFEVQEIYKKIDRHITEYRLIKG